MLKLTFRDLACTYCCTSGSFSSLTSIFDMRNLLRTFCMRLISDPGVAERARTLKPSDLYERMCVCVCLYVQICIHTCTHTNTQRICDPGVAERASTVKLCVHKHVCVCVSLYASAHVYMHAHTPRTHTHSNMICADICIILHI